MDELAREMKISKKTIYKYFPSKYDLVDKVTDCLMFGIRNSIREIVVNEENPVKVFHLIGVQLIKTLMKVSERWLDDLRIHYYDIWLKIDDFREKNALQNLGLTIEKGKQHGYFLDKPTPIILSTVIAGIRAVINPDFILNNKFSAHEAAQTVLLIIINGILTPKGRRIFQKLNAGQEL